MAPWNPRESSLHASSSYGRTQSLWQHGAREQRPASSILQIRIILDSICTRIKGGGDLAGRTNDSEGREDPHHDSHFIRSHHDSEDSAHGCSNGGAVHGRNRRRGLRRQAIRGAAADAGIAAAIGGGAGADEAAGRAESDAAPEGTRARAASRAASRRSADVGSADAGSAGTR